MELQLYHGAMAMADVPLIGCHLPWHLCPLPSGPEDKKRSKYSFSEHSHSIIRVAMKTSTVPQLPGSMPQETQYCGNSNYPLLPSKLITFWDACHRCSLLFTCVQCVARCFYLMIFLCIKKIYFWEKKVKSKTYSYSHKTFLLYFFLFSFFFFYLKTLLSTWVAS